MRLTWKDYIVLGMWSITFLVLTPATIIIIGGVNMTTFFICLFFVGSALMALGRSLNVPK